MRLKRGGGRNCVWLEGRGRGDRVRLEGRRSGDGMWL